MEAQPAAHPSEKTLSFYSLGQLDKAQAEAVRRHLSACGSCRTQLTGMKPVSNVNAAIAAQARHEETPAIGSSLVLPEQETAEWESPLLASSLPAGLADHPDYQVLRELGRGGMGVVYLAENRLMGRKEVLKVVSAHLLNRRGVLERFHREIRAAALLQHHNIVTAYSASRMGESVVLAMEYVDGTDLAKLVETQGPLPVTHACNFTYQAALGLQHAHERGMVHRDIKPSNLMLSRDGKKPAIKILDFGLAKVTSEAKADAGLTQEGQMLGTPHYISPEQMVNAQSADIRADIYSLGCTLYCMLAGHPPFDAPSLYELLQAHHSMDAPLLNQVRPDVPVELAALAAKMMAKNPEERFQTPIEVAQALAPFTRKASHGTAAHGGSRSTVLEGYRKESTESRGQRPGTQPLPELDEPHPAPAKAPAGPRFSARRLAMAGAALLVIGLIATLTLSRPKPPPAPSSSSDSTPAPALSPPSKPEPSESILADAEAAIRSSHWPEAMELIDRYLVNPQAGETEQASTMRLQLLAATSDVEADLIARGLNDQELEENLKQEARPMAAKVEIQELAVAYRDNMLRALKRERARRDTIAQDKPVQQHPPASGPSRKPRQERPADRQLGEASVSTGERRVPPPPRPERAPSLSSAFNGTARLTRSPGKATIDDILSAPERFDGETLVLDGLFRIGTRVERVKSQAGQAMGFSLSLARDDGRTLCTGDGKIVKQDMMLLVDMGVVSHLERMLRELRIMPSSRAVHRSILGVRMATLAGNDQPARALVIHSLEILASCNFRNVANGNLNEAFRIIEVDPSGARLRYGEGTKWVERLGGEEKFVSTIKRKLREMQRRIATNFREADFEKAFQKEMAVSMKMAEAQAQSIEAAVERERMGGMNLGVGGFR